MKDNTYNEILNRLRQIKPEPVSGTKLTDSIMNNLEYVILRKRRYLTLPVNETQWSIYKGLRALTSTAALFLVGFFVFQQWQINLKISRLEKVLANPYQYISTVQYPDRNLQFQNVLYELKSTSSTCKPGSQQSDVLLINRKSLNYLHKEIQKLRNENNSYRKKFMLLYPDSTFYNSNNR